MMLPEHDYVMIYRGDDNRCCGPIPEYFSEQVIKDLAPSFGELYAVPITREEAQRHRANIDQMAEEIFQGAFRPS